MTIHLTKENYNQNREQIDLCAGELCKIQKTEDLQTDAITYTIDTDTLTGWPFLSNIKLHGTSIVGSRRMTGLGVFLLIQKTEEPDGGCTLEFTDDLNPDIP